MTLRPAVLQVVSDLNRSLHCLTAKIFTYTTYIPHCTSPQAIPVIQKSFSPLHFSFLSYLQVLYRVSFLHIVSSHSKAVTIDFFFFLLSDFSSIYPTAPQFMFHFDINCKERYT